VRSRRCAGRCWCGVASAQYHGRVTQTAGAVDGVADEAGLDPVVRAAIQRWCDVSPSDRPAIEVLLSKAAAGDEIARAELRDAFAGVLPIGTGGRRGLCGPGPNRVNEIVMRQTAQGLGAAMRAEHAAEKVAIAYDTRADSRRFAHIVARQLAASGIAVTVLDAPRPTPQLSFLVRREGCGAGIVISASHNPPTDNGIKIYGPDGAQVLGARDRRLMEGIVAAGEAPLPPLAPEGDPRIDVVAGDALARADAAYHAWVRAQGVVHEPLGHLGLRVVFTPLHGVGHTSVVPALADLGISLSLVERQCDPDGGRFSSVRTANPEQEESLELAREQAEREGAHLVVATDPDADRVGALARDAEGALVFIDGNRLGALMLDHVLTNGPRPRNGWVLTTLVSTPLVRALAEAAGVEVVDDLLVGFKHHAAMMAEHPEKTVLFMFEEAHGYMRGDDVHDKDGAVAARLLVECAALALRDGVTLFHRLASIWARHGYHRERTGNLYAYGAAGRDAIARLVETWRATPPRGFGGLEVVGAEDRKAPRSTGSPTRDLPGNVLVYDLKGEAGACRLVVRPSGTEPKAKIYVLARSTAEDIAAHGLEAIRARIDALVERVLDDARVQAEAIMVPAPA
jgi:phosphoglucomutase